MHVVVRDGTFPTKGVLVQYFNITAPRCHKGQKLWLIRDLNRDPRRTGRALDLSPELRRKYESDPGKIADALLCKARGLTRGLSVLATGRGGCECRYATLPPPIFGLEPVLFLTTGRGVYRRMLIPTG